MMKTRLMMNNTPKPMYASNEFHLSSENRLRRAMYVARKSAVNLQNVSRDRLRAARGTYITFFGCQSITVFLR